MGKKTLHGKDVIFHEESKGLFIWRRAGPVRWDESREDVALQQFLTNQITKNRSRDVRKTIPSHQAGPALLHMIDLLEQKIIEG